MDRTDPSFLYVEDDMLSREVMKILVTRVLGYSQLTVLDNSQNFMEKVSKLPAVPDVVFLDIQMRNNDGYQMLKLLRADPVYKNTRIIAMTANVMATDVDKLREVGFDGLIGKPIMKDAFPDLLRRVLAGEAVWFIP